MIKHFSVLLLIVCCILSASTAQTHVDNGFIVKVGDKAPDFSTKLTNGKTFKLSEHRGKIIMLQFTASWCSVCRKEMPFIENDIWLKLKDKKFTLIGLDRDEPMDVALAFEKQMKISYPLGLDPGADIFGLYALKTSGVTRNVIIDEHGKIIFLSRLFEIQEFNTMKDVIFQAVKRLE
jgi:peroxiredoxin